MFREMKRKNQQLLERETIEILMKGTAGIMDLIGDGGYIYSLPTSYVYHDGKIYFHSVRGIKWI